MEVMAGFILTDLFATLASILSSSPSSLKDTDDEEIPLRRRRRNVNALRNLKKFTPGDAEDPFEFGSIS